jgi:hypothetical protein
MQSKGRQSQGKTWNEVSWVKNTLFGAPLALAQVSNWCRPSKVSNVKILLAGDHPFAFAHGSLPPVEPLAPDDVLGWRSGSPLRFS